MTTLSLDALTEIAQRTRLEVDELRDTVSDVDVRLAKLETDHDGQWLDQRRTNNQWVDRLQEQQERMTGLEGRIRTQEDQRNVSMGRQTVIIAVIVAVGAVLQTVVGAVIVKALVK